MPALSCARRRFLLACAGWTAGAATAAGLPTVRWGLFRNYQPVYVGIAQGLFQRAGVNVVLSGNFSSGPALIQAAGIGHIDAGHSAITGLANAAAQGVGVIGVADSQTEFADAPLQQWFVGAHAPIRTVADLRGKRIAVNSLSGSFYYTTLIALQGHGIGKHEVHFVTLPHERQEQALLAGSIDVASLIDPYSVAAAANARVRRLFTGADVLGERQFSLVFFRKKLVEEQAPTITRFLTGYRQAIAFLRDDPAGANAVMAQALGVQNKLIVPHRYTAHARVLVRDAQFWLDTMRAGGELGRAPGLRVGDVATDRFNP
ncbi:ABC transporter substrate-binding protein [Massilia atriviolacea]|uniref:ABC transporter substrate-binding protein n=1 Tax=Massilia atriviolacea TaxID=2495579 RepID=A0A430HN05_9BURK|nr:ABC transporter substrate-binding protein [Massilia atriviolacea]RSZ58871.1 ABC transporter substrate-binding protein [Massilia atriviolacea]